MNPIQQASNYDKIAEHWSSDRFNRENGISQHKRAINFAPQTGRLNKTGILVGEGIYFVPVLLFLDREIYFNTRLNTVITFECNISINQRYISK